MAEETQKTTAEEVVVVADVPPPPPPPEKEKEKELPPAPEPEKPEKPAVVEAAGAEEEVKEKPKAEAEAETEAEEEKKKEEEEVKMPQSSSFKEESNVVSELPESQKKALDELKSLIQEALNNHEFSSPPPPPPPPPPVASHPTKEDEKPSEPQSQPEPEPEPPLHKDEKKEEKSHEEEEVLPQDPPKPEEEPAKPEDTPIVIETPPPPPPAEPVVVEEVVVEEKKAADVDEDGAKTVEAIKETIIEVTPPKESQEPSAEPKEEPPKAEPEAKPEAETEAVPRPPPEEVFIWGIPILGDERSDVILLKFLRARDFKVKDAFTMIKNTVRWRKDFGIEELLEQDLGSDLEKVVYMHGFDKENHPVCYNVYGEFQNKELYQNTFSDEEKRKKFLKWRIQFLEKSIRKLDFSPTGVCTIVQVNDLKNFPGFGKWELRQATKQALQILQDNYPEFVARQVFINVPWWYLAFNKMISPFLTQRTKSKFVFASPAKSAETLFKYIAPEQVPVSYGGLSGEGEQDFATADPATEFTIKPTSKHTVEFPVSEKCVLVWEVRVVGWDVTYGAEFVPGVDDGYTVIVQKARKIGVADENVISNTFKIGEPGKVLVTIDNQSSKKKKLLYRSKIKPCSD